MKFFNKNTSILSISTGIILYFLMFVNVNAASFIDIGLRVNQGTASSPSIQKIAIINPSSSAVTGGTCTADLDPDGSGNFQETLICTTNTGVSYNKMITVGGWGTLTAYYPLLDQICGLSNYTQSGTILSETFTCNTPIVTTSPLKISRSGFKYSIALVDATDPNALKVHIRLTDGTIKALRKF